MSQKQVFFNLQNSVGEKKVFRKKNFQPRKKFLSEIPSEKNTLVAEKHSVTEKDVCHQQKFLSENKGTVTEAR